MGSFASIPIVVACHIEEHSWELSHLTPRPLDDLARQSCIIVRGTQIESYISQVDHEIITEEAIRVSQVTHMPIGFPVIRMNICDDRKNECFLAILPFNVSLESLAGLPHHEFRNWLSRPNGQAGNESDERKKEFLVHRKTLNVVC